MNRYFDVSGLRWINQPERFTVSPREIRMTTKPRTDYWQRTYYHFRNDNAHALVMEIDKDFTFITKTDFNSKVRYDQCGVVIYQDSSNWFKASVEYENESVSRLGSVVTNYGYSDWATTDIDTGIKSMWYRLSRRGQDFLIESSGNGMDFRQMRIFHMHEELKIVYAGIYACSPLQSSFEAVFTEFELTDCVWKAHK